MKFLYKVSNQYHRFQPGMISDQKGNQSYCTSLEVTGYNTWRKKNYSVGAKISLQEVLSWYKHFTLGSLKGSLQLQKNKNTAVIVKYIHPKKTAGWLTRLQSIRKLVLSCKILGVDLSQCKAHLVKLQYKAAVTSQAGEGGSSLIKCAKK